MRVRRRGAIVGGTSTEEVEMAGVEKRDFDSPDESRTPDKTRVDVVHLGGTTAARGRCDSR